METYQALALFVFLSVITPGPNNLMIMTSAMNFGVARSMPHFAGIALGSPLMMTAMGLGLGQVFNSVPELVLVLQVVCGAMIVWLAWKMTRFGGAGAKGEAEAKPIGLLQAMAFQWVNPKAWFMCTATVSLFPPRADYFVMDVLTTSVVAAATALLCTGAWMLSGVPLRKWINNQLYMKRFNLTMATSLVGFYVVSVFYH